MLRAAVHPGRPTHNLHGAQKSWLRSVPCADVLGVAQTFPGRPIDGSFDFLYLPMSSGGKTTRGYVFINLVSETNAASFRERWHMRRLPHFQRSRRQG